VLVLGQFEWKSVGSIQTASHCDGDDARPSVYQSEWAFILRNACPSTWLSAHGRDVPNASNHDTEQIRFACAV
jgi:hypothetical protein